MSARGWKLSLAGLGALTLSCAGLQQAAALTGTSEVATAHFASTVGKALFDSNDCEKLAARVSFEEERALGGAVALNWVKGGKGLMRSTASAPSEGALQEYVNIVGRNLAAQSSRPTLPWTFGVLRDAEAHNAASAPGGYVFVTLGLLTTVEDEAQLAGVLAHEIAHVTLQHALTRYDEVKVKQCKTVVAVKAFQQAGEQFNPAWSEPFGVAIQGDGGLNLDAHVDLLGKMTGSLVEKLVSEGYAHPDEYAADEVAVRLLVSAGYDPRGYIDFLGKLRSGATDYAHHPRPADRQTLLRKLLAKSRPDPKKPTEDFPELPAADGLQKPPLDPAFAIVRMAARSK